MSNISVELEYLEALANRAGDLKNAIKEVAESAGIQVFTTDNPLTLLSKIRDVVSLTPNQMVKSADILNKLTSKNSSLTELDYSDENIDLMSDLLVILSNGNRDSLNFSTKFSENSWNTISIISNEISLNGYNSVDVLAKYGWFIGDSKTFTLKSGEEIECRIIGFNHDSDVSGNKIGISLGTFTQYPVGYAFDTGDDSTIPEGRYGGCSFVTTAIPEILSNFPDDLLSLLRISEKIIALDPSRSPYNGTYGTVISKIFLFSMIEWDSTWAQAIEGETYEYWIQNPKDWVVSASRTNKDDGVFAILENLNKELVEDLGNHKWIYRVIFGFCI